MAYDEKVADRIRKLLGTHEVVERKMMGRLAFMVRGAMACTIGDDDLLVHVSPGDREALITQPNVSPMTMGKRTMSGFVRVAPAAYTTDAALKTWLDIGLRAPPAKHRARR